MSERDSNSLNPLLLQPGQLWAAVLNRTQHALECGALQSIPTETEFIEQGGIRFLVRILSSLVRKEAARKKQVEAESPSKSATAFNPFLPYDADLFVADLSDTHVCLLNKYNVVDHHLLIITRAFEEQESPLNLQDFKALWLCLAELDGLAFYNSGKTAGASQRHKHLQLVPLPLVPEGPNIPLESVLPSAQWQGAIGTIPALPFPHALLRLNDSRTGSPSDAAAMTLDAYYMLLTATDLYSEAAAQAGRSPDAYNLLMTRQWMLIVPRTQEEFASIPVNSLGFAGTFFVRDQDQLQHLKDRGPLTILEGVVKG